MKLVRYLILNHYQGQVPNFKCMLSIESHNLIDLSWVDSLQLDCDVIWLLAVIWLSVYYEKWVASNGDQGIAIHVYAPAWLISSQIYLFLEHWRRHHELAKGSQVDHLMVHYRCVWQIRTCLMIKVRAARLIGLVELNEVKAAVFLN